MDRRDNAKLGVPGKLAVVCGGILPSIALGTMPVMLPGISDAFGTATNSVLIKMIATALGLGMMFGAPLGGLLADRYGRRLILIIGVIVAGIFGCGAMFATNPWHLILARLVVGVATGTMVTGIIAVIGDNFRGIEQSRWLGYNGATSTLSILILVPVAGFLSDTGWQNGFLVYSAALPILYLIILGIPSDRHEMSSVRAAQPISEASWPWSAILLATVVGTISTGTSLYWPFRLREVGVLSTRDLAFYALPNIVFVGTASFAFGTVRRYLSVRSVFILCGLLSAAGLLIIASGNHAWLILVGLMVEGAAVGLLSPNVSTYAVSVSEPANRARTVGLVKGALFGSPFLTQFLLEPLSQSEGTWAPLCAIAVLSLGLSIFMATCSAREG